MSDVKIQYYGIKYPFTANNKHGFFIDLNRNEEDKVASEIAHVLLTRKGDRLRKPEFGTNLINFIFDPSDTDTWDGIKEDVTNAVARFVPNTNLTDISIVRGDDDNTIYLDMKYSVTKGNKIENNRMVINL